MTFAYPMALWALLIPLALIALGWIRGGHRVALPFDHKEIPQGRGWHVVLRCAQVLPKLILAVGILLLAGPRKLDQPKQVRELTNIQFCIDVSGSMTAEFGSGDRYEVAMAAMNQFIGERKGDAFALTIFGNEYLHWVPLTSDASAFQCAAPFLHPNKLPSEYGGTSIGKAIKACVEVLDSRDEGDKMLVLISDGQSGDIQGNNQDTLIEKLNESGIVLFAIHIGEGQIPAELDNIASETGGGAFPAGDKDSLEFVFKKIDGMKKAKLKQVTPDPVDYFTPFIIVGLSLFGAHLVCLFGLRYTPW